MACWRVESAVAIPGVATNSARAIITAEMRLTRNVLFLGLIGAPTFPARSPGLLHSVIYSVNISHYIHCCTSKGGVSHPFPGRRRILCRTVTASLPVRNRTRLPDALPRPGQRENQPRPPQGTGLQGGSTAVKVGLLGDEREPEARARPRRR